MTTIALDSQELVYFDRELAERKRRIHEFLAAKKYQERFTPSHIYEGAYVYLARTGKALRPVYLLWCCGATGGADREYLGVIPAAAVETYHTWGLVHDDIIDMDDLRRGGPTVHRLFAQRSRDDFGYEAADAERYGLAVAILAGDALMAWTVALLGELYDVEGVDPSLPRYFIDQLCSHYIPTIIDGEITDVFYEKADIDQLSADDLMTMSYKKTGSIFALAGMMGAMVGINRADPQHPYVAALTEFATKSGLAFQLIDDVINIVGDVKATGKAVGSDIVVGKRTLPILYALHHADGQDKAALLKVFGSANAAAVDLVEAIEVVKRSGGVDDTRRLAFNLVAQAFDSLQVLPESPYKRLIHVLGRRLVDRNI